MSANNNPPPEVAAAARTVQAWIDQGQGQPLSAEQVAKLTPAQRIDYCRGFDQSKMPPNPYDVNRADRA
jgi:hypothetical protein